MGHGLTQMNADFLYTQGCLCAFVLWVLEAKMTWRFLLLGLIAVWALVGCQGTAEPDPAPTAIPTVAEIELVPTIVPEEPTAVPTPEPTDELEETAVTGSNTVIGTINATLDGESFEWYMVTTGRRGLGQSSSLWFTFEEFDEILVALGGYEDPNIFLPDIGPDSDVEDMDEFLADFDYDGSSFGLVFEYLPGATSVTYTLTGDYFDADGRLVAVYYSPVFSPEAFTDFLREDLACFMAEGTLEVTRIEAEVGENGRFEGSFSGTLTCQIEGMPNTITVTNGRFQGLEIPYDDES
jgi:hypothetical protein